MPDSLDGASYDKILSKIAPGKIISADLLEWVVERLRIVEGRTQKRDGTQVLVPKVFGQTLEQALSTLEDSSADLQVGRVIDAEGRTFEPPHKDVLKRTVINQVPPPEARRAAGSKVDLVLSESIGVGTIRGTVVGQNSGEPLPGANVVISDADGVGTTTNANGQFRISGLPVGTRTVRVTLVGYESKTSEVVVEPGKTAEVNVQLSSAITDEDEVTIDN